ncbi:MAG TPA: carbon-nitrogen hydrolase family protein [Clostridia bacterium]|nr:carbon-nitrogen hydrolase family protein [Clostridia bacterium]
MRIGVFQFASGADIQANADSICKAIQNAAKSGVRLLVFHECAACGYPPVETPDIDRIDYEALDALYARICRLAKECDLYVAVGMIRQENAKRYNSIRVISPEGPLGDYDKRALWGWDLDQFERGASLGLFDIDGVKVGFRMCYEVRFPEYFRELFQAKAELCFVSFNDVSDPDSPERYQIIRSNLLTRAVENVMTVVSVNSISSHQTAPTAVFDIDGHVALEAPRNEETLLVYDYLRPEIGFSAQGRIENSELVMRR